MPNTFEHIETLIARSLENNLSAEEQATLQAWLKEDATHQRYYEELQKTWTLTGSADTDFTPDTDRNWERFRQHLEIPSAPQLKPLRSYRQAIRIAATILLLAGAATLYFVFLHGPQTVTVLTGAREKKQVTLPDGSHVFLNQHSSLRYARNLTGAERAIYLEGEAFFEVAQQEARPFVVYANHTQTQVLGTSFDIKAYAAQPVEVSVLSGKVAVSSKTSGRHSKDRLVLTTGRKAIFRDNEQMEEIAIADPNFMAWKEHKLYFRDMRLGDVIATLESYYGVRIVIQDSAVVNYSYNGTFDDDPRLEVVLNVIAATADLSWTKEQGVYKLGRK